MREFKGFYGVVLAVSGLWSAYVMAVAYNNGLEWVEPLVPHVFILALCAALVAGGLTRVPITSLAAGGKGVAVILLLAAAGMAVLGLASAGLWSGVVLALAAFALRKQLGESQILIVGAGFLAMLALTFALTRAVWTGLALATVALNGLATYCALGLRSAPKSDQPPA